LCDPLPGLSHKRRDRLVIVDVDPKAGRHLVFVSSIPEDNCCATLDMAQLGYRVIVKFKIKHGVRDPFCAPRPRRQLRMHERD
jgi:hypothetical protein